MNALIIYDSVFGNTEQVAFAIRDGLTPHGPVDILKVSEADTDALADRDLLIVGSPTRAFQATKATTSFLKSLSSASLRGVRVAAFDTRIAVEDTNVRVLKFLIGIFGYAAKPISLLLEKRGGTLAAPPEGFHVGDTEGPLKEGELERASAWSAGLISP